MNLEYQKLALKNDIQSRVRTDLDQQQREYYLNQQMKTIQEELGVVSYEQEIDEMRKRAKTKKWDDQTGKQFEKEISKLQRMNPQVAEYSVQRNYLDFFLDLPWNQFSKEWKIEDIDQFSRTVSLDDLDFELKKILQGGQTGRVIVKTI